MEQKVKQEGLDLLFRLKEPTYYAKVLAMIDWQIERFSEHKKREFENENIFKRLLCFPDTYHWETEMSKGTIKIVHDVHKELQFIVYKGDAHDDFRLCFDEEETAYSILIKPVKVEDLYWIKRQNTFLLEFYPYMVRELEIKGLRLEDPMSLVLKRLERNYDNLVNSYISFLHDLNYTRMGRRILRDILGISLLIII